MLVVRIEGQIVLAVKDIGLNLMLVAVDCGEGASGSVEVKELRARRDVAYRCAQKHRE